jgi:exosortase
MREERAKFSVPWNATQLWLALALVCAAVLAMGSTWSDWWFISTQIEEHSHVFLAIPFGAAIMYVNRKEFGAIRQIGPSWVGPIIALVGLALTWDGYNHARQSFWHIGAVLVALGCAVSILGHGVLLKFWPAFFILGFMVPMPNTLRLKLAHPLQAGNAYIVERFFHMFGGEVGRQGNSITVNGQHVLIVEACNGLRGVFTLILVCWLFAFVTPIKNWVRWLIILLSPVTAMVCNVIRLVPTVLLHGHASKETAEKFHDYAGWGMVIVAFLFLMGVIHVIEWFGVEVREGKDGDDRGGDGGASESNKPSLVERSGQTRMSAPPIPEGM